MKTASTGGRTLGLDFARRVMAFAATGGEQEAAERFAVQRWGASMATAFNKAAVGPIDGTALKPGPEHEFLSLAWPQSIIGRLPLRSVPANTYALSTSVGADGHWVGMGDPVLMTRMSLSGTTLEPLSVGALIVFTRDLMRAAAPGSEKFVRDELMQALVGVADATFIDPHNAGVNGVSPPSITYGVDPVPPTGDLVEDLEGLIADFNGDFSRAHFIMSPETATRYALQRDSSGTFIFFDIGPAGGSLIGVPVVTSRHVPLDMIVMVDPGRVAAITDGQVTAQTADQAAVMVQDDAPGSQPTALSLWQNGCAGLVIRREVNWVAADGAVSVLRAEES